MRKGTQSPQESGSGSGCVLYCSKLECHCESLAEEERCGLRVASEKCLISLSALISYNYVICGFNYVTIGSRHENEH